MNILLNLYPVQSGGGQQVASNFIKVIGSNDFHHSWRILVGEGSTLDKIASQYLLDEQIIRYPYSYVNRIRISSKIKKYILKQRIDIVLNFTTVLSGIKIPQVVRSVYSNLYFPEINFWGDYPIAVRIKKKIIDYFRLKGTIKADGIIFENKSMMDRASDLFSYPKEKSIYISPSVSKFSESEIDSELNYINSYSEFKVLYLSTWHLNKNIHILPDVAKKIKKQGFRIKFILTLQKNSKDVLKYLMPKIIDHKLENYFEFVGNIKPVHVHQIVKMSDAMILLSKLECFSSNIMEAFTFGKPLIISNEDWAKSACLEAALYVDRNDPKNISDSIIELAEHEVLRRKLTDMGKKVLVDNFNTPEEKVEEMVDFLEYIYAKY